MIPLAPKVNDCPDVADRLVIVDHDEMCLRFNAPQTFYRVIDMIEAAGSFFLLES